MSQMKKWLSAFILSFSLASCGSTLSVKAWQAPGLNPAPGSIIAFYEKGKYINLYGGVPTLVFNMVTEDFEDVISGDGVHRVHEKGIPKLDYAVDLSFYYKASGGDLRVSCQVYEGSSPFAKMCRI